MIQDEDDLGEKNRIPDSRLVAGPSDAGLRLDAFLARRFGRSRKQLRENIEGAVRSASNQPLKWSHRMSCEEEIFIPRLQRPEPDVEVSYRILYEDEYLVAVDKGPGAPVHPARAFRERTILTHLRRDLEDPELRPAHRLDRETSGVLIFTRDRASTTALMTQFAKQTPKKRYLAVVQGRPDFDHVRLDLPLDADPDFPIKIRRCPSATGQKAITDFEVLERHPKVSLVAAEPWTGRQHQIRVHLASLGHPILGDKLYLEEGRPYLDLIKNRLGPEDLARLGHSRQALHAERLRLLHPADKREMEFIAPLPDDLLALLV